MNKKKNLDNDGITLIALVVSIIILIILATISINIILNGGLFRKADDAGYMSRMARYKEEVDLYVIDKIAEAPASGGKNINSGEPLKEVIAAYEREGEKFDITEAEVNIPIKTIIPDIEKRDENYIVVYKGETYYVKSDKNKNAEREAELCLNVGIKILELTRPSGMDNTKGSYEFVNGVYMCTPELGDGFNKYTTRYANETKKGTITPGKWIFNKPDKDWYDYKNRKWANLVVESEGAETYFVWIPRYCFKLDEKSQRSDVKLIATDNSYKDPYDEDEENVTPWEELKAQGYQVPEAFTFDGRELPGFWIMKYNMGETPTPSIVDYDMITKAGAITIRNTRITNPPEDVSKCIVYLNGVVKYTLTDKSEIEAINSREFRMEGLRKGDNVINITLLDANEQMVGSRTRIYSIADVNDPDLSGFEDIKDTTFYVTYDENGNEHSTIPLSSGKEPDYWYNYSESEWANIVVRNNGGEIYYTWIPRYEYILNDTDQKSTIKFVKGTSTETTSGYQIPEGFTFDGKQLSGFWLMKYNIGDVNTTLFDTTAVASGTTITTQGVKGSSVAEGQTYTYYVDGKKDGNTTEAATAEHEFKNLKPNTTHTILVEIRDKSTDALLGTIVKQVETSQPNPPKLTGFNADCTYYVTYDDDGNESIGDKIKNDGSNMPKNWYDYGKSKWANIVVKGKKTDGTETATYYTWIPRYQYRLDDQTQRSNVKFIEGTSGATEGYQMPEAFNFDGKELTGYWLMKYNIGDM